MKRMFLILLALSLLLTACGKQEKPTAPVPEEPTEQTEEIRVVGLYQVVCEWEEYDTSAESISFWVENHSEADIETGVDYGLEVRDDAGAWQQVPMVENAAWIAVALSVPAGERIALTCALTLFDWDFSQGGTYRIVKVLEGESCTGEFTMRPGAAVSGAKPYGFAPLEELPEDFGASAAVGDEVVFTGEWIQNLEAVTTFLNKSGSGVECQLRTVQDYGEGTPMVIDVICENGHFLWRMWSQGAVTEQRFSYIVTDGLDLFLSNGVDWANTERYESDTAFLIPHGATAAMVTAVGQQAAERLEHNVIRYRVWSADGAWDAGLTAEPSEFSVGWQKKGQGSRGQIFDVSGETGAVTDLAWQPDGSLHLTCETTGDGGRLVFDPESWSLKD